LELRGAVTCSHADEFLLLVGSGIGEVVVLNGLNGDVMAVIDAQVPVGCLHSDLQTGRIAIAPFAFPTPTESDSKHLIRVVDLSRQHTDEQHRNKSTPTKSCPGIRRTSLESAIPVSHRGRLNWEIEEFFAEQEEEANESMMLSSRRFVKKFVGEMDELTEKEKLDYGIALSVESAEECAWLNGFSLEGMSESDQLDFALLLSKEEQPVSQLAE